MVSRKLIVMNKSGLHVRPAGIVVKAAESCSSQIEILYGHYIVNAKSLLNILSAAIAQGEEIELQCRGPKEQEDLEKMVRVFQTLEG